MCVYKSQSLFPVIAERAVCRRYFDNGSLAHFEQGRKLVYQIRLRMPVFEVIFIICRRIKGCMGAKVASPFPAVVFQFVCEPSIVVREQFKFAMLVCAHIRFEVGENVFPNWNFVRIRS
jgi:hypothetical protein